MAFFSKFFGSKGNAFQHVTDTSIDRGDLYIMLPSDARVPFSEQSRTSLVKKALGVSERFGSVQEFSRGIARHTVGVGISAQFNTESEDWNNAAMLAVERYCMSPAQCDLSGRRSVYEQQKWIAEQFSIVGETFTAFIENPEFPSPVSGVGNCPSFFNISANDIKTPPKSNVPIHDGVEFGQYGRTSRYWARMFGEDAFQSFDARDVAHIYHARGAHDSRAFPPMSPSLNRMIDADELHRMQVRGEKARRQVAVIIKGLQAQKNRGPLGGKLKSAAESNGTDGSTAVDTAQMEQLYGHAGAAIARMGEDGSVELLESNSPGDALANFLNNTMLADASLALGISPHFWNPEKLGGANIRGIYASADATFRSLADKVIYGFFEPLIIRFIRWRVASGLLPAPPGGIDGDWTDKMTYRRPRRVTVDNGRDSNARCTEVARFLSTLRDEYDEQGRDYKPAIQQRNRELAYIKSSAIAEGLSEDEAKMVVAVSLGLQPQVTPPKPAEPKEETETETP